MTYTQQIMARIFDNIEINVSNVYFRFEDEIVNKRAAKREWFGMGLMLKEFSVFSADASYQKTEAGDEGDEDDQEVKEAGLSFKVARLKGFRLFCDWEGFSSTIK